MGKENENAKLVIEEVKKAIKGKDDCIMKTFAAILAGGHILLEDVPGVGKTTLAVAFSKAMALDNKRVQFTPDVMPSDILGFNMYHKETGDFEYRPGPIMCNLFLADEINRTSPKTQSALLEVMEEGSVSIDGDTMTVPAPFFVMATQNPKGSSGTQLLPESQLDRFMIRVSMGYPSFQSEVMIVKGKTKNRLGADLTSVICKEELIAMQEAAENVYADESIYEYIVSLVNATRENPYIELGMSPRGSISSLKMAKAWAFIKGRNYVIPEDVTAVFPSVATHRIVLNTKARATRISADAVISEVLASVKQPTSYSERKDYRA